MIKAIDIHVHPHDEQAIKPKGARNAQMAKLFGKDTAAISLDELADRYREHEMIAVLLNATDVSSTGIIPVPNDHIASAVKHNPDVFIGFGAVDP